MLTPTLSSQAASAGRDWCYYYSDVIPVSAYSRQGQSLKFTSKIDLAGLRNWYSSLVWFPVTPDRFGIDRMDIQSRDYLTRNVISIGRGEYQIKRVRSRAASRSFSLGSLVNPPFWINALATGKHGMRNPWRSLNMDYGRGHCPRTACIACTLEKSAPNRAEMDESRYIRYMQINFLFSISSKHRRWTPSTDRQIIKLPSQSNKRVAHRNRETIASTDILLVFLNQFCLQDKARDQFVHLFIVHIVSLISAIA
jgi:hypothetical protein